MLQWIYLQNTPITQALKHCGRGTEGLHGPEDHQNEKSVNKLVNKKKNI